MDASGANIDLPGYSVKLTVSPAADLGPAAAQPAGSEALLIRVAVYYNGAEAITLDGYRLRYAPNSPP